MPPCRLVAIQATTTPREVEMLALMVKGMRDTGRRPGALYLDNGATYTGDVLMTLCSRLDINLLHAKAEDPQARGKMERFWRTLRQGCLYHLGTPGSLHDVQVRLLAFLAQHYHVSPHASLMGKTPAEVYETAPRDATVVTETQLGFESEHPGYCGAQDTFYLGTLKGVARIYQQTFVDTYSKVAFAKLYQDKTPLTPADLLNDRVVPFFEGHGIRLLRVLTDRGTEFCGLADKHPYELYLAIEDIEHTRTRVRRPQTNGICERFHKTILDEFYRITFRKSSTRTSMNCRAILTPGSGSSTNSAHTRADGASGKHR